MEWARLRIAQEQAAQAIPILRFVANNEESSPSVQQQAQTLLREQAGVKRDSRSDAPALNELLAEILGFVPRRV